MPGPDNKVTIHTQEPLETKAQPDSPESSSSSSIWSYATSSIYGAASSVAEAGSYVASSTYGAGTYITSSVGSATSSIVSYVAPDPDLRSAGSDAAYYAGLKAAVPLAATVGTAVLGFFGATAAAPVVAVAGLSFGIGHIAGNIGSKTYQSLFGAQDVTAEIRVVTQGCHSLAIIQESVSGLNENMTTIANALPAEVLNSIDFSGLAILTTIVGLKKETHVKARDLLIKNQSVDFIPLMYALNLMKNNIEVLKKQYEFLNQEKASIQGAVERIQSAALAGPASQNLQQWWALPGMDWRQIPGMIANLGAQLDSFELIAQYQTINKAIQPYSQAYLRAMATQENLESVSNSMVNAVINTFILSSADQSGAVAQQQAKNFSDDVIHKLCTGIVVQGALEAAGVGGNVVSVAKLYNKEITVKMNSLLTQLSEKLNINEPNMRLIGLGAQGAILMSAGPAASAGGALILAAPDIAKFLVHNATRTELVKLFTTSSAQAKQREVRDLMVQIMQCVLIAEEEHLLNGEIQGEGVMVHADNAELLQACTAAGSAMGLSLSEGIPNYLNQTASQALGAPNIDITTRILAPGYFASLQALFKKGAVGAIGSLFGRQEDEAKKPPRLK